MNLTSLIETFGDHSVLAMGGALIGLMFGFLPNALSFAHALPSLNAAMAPGARVWPCG